MGSSSRKSTILESTTSPCQSSTPLNLAPLSRDSHLAAWNVFDQPNGLAARPWSRGMGKLQRSPVTGKEWSNWPTLQTGPGWTFSISSFLQCGHIAKTCHNYIHKTSKVEGLKAEDDETSKVEYVEWYPMVSPSSFGYILGQWLQLPGFNTAGITDMIDSHAWKDRR